MKLGMKKIVPIFNKPLVIVSYVQVEHIKHASQFSDVASHKFYNFLSLKNMTIKFSTRKKIVNK